MAKSKFIIYGSSHAKRIFWAVKRIPTINKRFEIINYSRSGSLPSNHPLPDISGLKSNDILLVTTTGNCLFKRITDVKYEKGKRVYYLKYFCPQEQTVIDREWSLLHDSLEKVNCNIILLDNIYRHLKRNLKHNNKQIYIYQRKQNIKFRKYFSNIPNVRVINHLTLLSHIRTKKSSFLEQYSKLSGDNVHLKFKCYFKIVRKLEHLGLFL